MQEVIKYCAISEHTLSNLKQRKLWAGSPIAFNDPFEFRLQKNPNPSGLQQLRSENPHLERLSNAGLVESALNEYQDQLKQWGVACLARSSADNVLMWSHYGDQHRGICLCFAGDNLLAPKGALIEVVYQDQYPELRFDLIWNIDGLAKIIRTKNSCWSYEKEVRLIRTDGPQLVDYPAPLKRVVFGLRTSAENQVLVRNTIGDDATEYCRVLMHPTDYKLVVEPLD